MPADGDKRPLVILCGPTASGKTSLALELAQRFAMEIVSADSRQVYRGMDIGTAKPRPDELRQISHHLIDVVDPDAEFNAATYAGLASRAVDQIVAGNRLPIAVGGTGLYLQVLTSGLVDAPAEDADLRRRLRRLEMEEGEGALHRRLETVDPLLAARLSPRDLVRIIRALEVHAVTGQPLSRLQQEHGFAESPYRTLWLGINPPRDELYRRIDQRVLEMFASGLVEEVEGLLARYPAELKAFCTIGYREVIALLNNQLDLQAAIAQVQLHSRRYAKRQLTWFRKNSQIIWVDSCDEFARISKFLECFNA